jgi:hypothetical protein
MAACDSCLRARTTTCVNGQYCKSEGRPRDERQGTVALHIILTHAPPPPPPPVPKPPQEKNKVRAKMFVDGRLNPDMVGQSAYGLGKLFGVNVPKKYKVGRCWLAFGGRMGFGD